MLSYGVQPLVLLLPTVVACKQEMYWCGGNCGLYPGYGVNSYGLYTLYILVWAVLSCPVVACKQEMSL